MNKMYEIIYNDINNNTDNSYLVLCDNIDTQYIIKGINEEFNNHFVNISFMSFDEFIMKRNLGISNNNKDSLIIKIMDHFSMDYDGSKMYLDNIGISNFVHKEDYKIKEIYEFIKPLLIKDKAFDLYLKNKKIFVLREQIDNYQKEALEGLDYELISLNDSQVMKHRYINKFDNYYYEIGYCFDSICFLINNGVKLDDIYIVSTSSDYELLLERISRLYSLDLNIKDHCLYDLDITRELLDKYFKGDDLSEIDLNETEYIYYKQLINIINRYPKFKNNRCYKEFLIGKIKDAKIKKGKSILNVININECFDICKFTKEKKYIFIIGMYQGNIPFVLKDEDYISDDIKQVNGLFTSKDINVMNINKLREIINSDNAIQMSFALNSFNNKYIVSSISNDSNIEIISNDFSYSKYSKQYNLEVYMMKYDDYYKYKIIDNDLYDLNKTYHEYNIYNTYNNEFTGLGEFDVLDLKKDRIDLSYSSMNSFRECGFKYYLDRILGLNENEDNFNTFIGTIFHRCLEKCLGGSDFETIYNEAVSEGLSKYNPSESELYLMKNIKLEMLDLIDHLIDTRKYIYYDNERYEEKVKVSNIIKVGSHHVKCNFSGNIDKLYYKKLEIDGKKETFVCIVDYKTSDKINFDIKLVDAGLSLQLPIYAYLSKHIDGFDNVSIAGLYIQHILASKVQANKLSNTSMEGIQKYKENLRRLDGITNSSLTDDTKFIDSALVIKKRNDYNNDDIEELVKKVERIIEESFALISKGIFKINPKKKGTTDLSCSYCKYKDVCFKTNKDIVYIEDEKENSEEAGEIDD